MRKHTTLAWLGGVCAVLLGLASAIVTWHRGPAFAVTTALSVMAMLLNLLAIPFFLWGKMRFSVGLQRAYLMLSIGIGAFGVAQAQLPLVDLLNLGWWINYGGIAIPYLVGVIGIFWGIRRFSLLLGAKSVWTSIAWALLATGLLSVIAALLPHVYTSESEVSFDIALALSVCNSVFITFAAVAAFGIRAKIGEAYTRSMNWLCAALAAISFAGWHYTIVQMTMTTGDWYYDYSATIVPFVAGALLLIVSGHAFDAIDFLAAPTTKHLNDERTELDVVLYVASLVSRPADVDAILDTVRDLTSRLEPGQALLPVDRQNLLHVYEQLEAYLAQRDPLHTILPAELRKKVREQFDWSPEFSSANSQVEL